MFPISNFLTQQTSNDCTSWHYLCHSIWLKIAHYLTHFKQIRDTKISLRNNSWTWIRNLPCFVHNVRLLSSLLYIVLCTFQNTSIFLAPNIRFLQCTLSTCLIQKQKLLGNMTMIMHFHLLHSVNSVYDNLFWTHFIVSYKKSRLFDWQLTFVITSCWWRGCGVICRRGTRPSTAPSWCHGEADIRLQSTSSKSLQPSAISWIK